MLAIGSFSGYSGEHEPFSPHAKWYTLIRPDLVHFDRPLTIMEMPYFHSHRAVVSYYRSLIPESANRFIGGYSIKKNGNIHGLVFGSGHHLGMEKWLKSSWKKDPVRGEANFDIDGDNLDPHQGSLFPEIDRPTKLKRFEESLEKLILCGKIKTDAEVYLYSLREGCLSDHAREVIRQLKLKGLLAKGRHRVSKDSVNDPRPLAVL